MHCSSVRTVLSDRGGSLNGIVGDFVGHAPGFVRRQHGLFERGQPLQTSYEPHEQNNDEYLRREAIGACEMSISRT